MKEVHLWVIGDREVLYIQSQTHTIYADTTTEEVFTSNGTPPTPGELHAITTHLAGWKTRNEVTV